MKVIDKTEELYKLLSEHPPELILGALDEMSRMNREEFKVINKQEENQN